MRRECPPGAMPTMKAFRSTSKRAIPVTELEHLRFATYSITLDIEKSGFLQHASLQGVLRALPVGVFCQQYTCIEETLCISK